jgi:hypothetical protein
VESPEIDGDDEPSLLIAELNDVKGDEEQKNDRQEHQRRDHASCAFRPRTETQSPEARQEFRREERDKNYTRSCVVRSLPAMGVPEGATSQLTDSF